VLVLGAEERGDGIMPPPRHLPTRLVSIPPNRNLLRASFLTAPLIGSLPRKLDPPLGFPGIHRRHQEEALKLSARNRIPATVTRITQGEAIANVEMDANGQRIVSSITIEAAGELALAEGKEVIAVIKASDVIVAVED
jgi:molybdopterin-binding protein